MTDLFKRAAAYRKTHKGVSMPEAIKLLAGKGKKAPVKKARSKKAPVKKARSKKAPVKKARSKKGPVKKARSKKAPVKKTAKPILIGSIDSLYFNQLKGLIEKRNSLKPKILHYQHLLKSANKHSDKIYYRKNILELKKIVVQLNKQISFTKRYIK